ncbi:MAG: hypothetical protein LPH21_08150, partial [Shewanella sp.]|nr:hypothetical protein [Shewanella sp.]
YEVISEAMLLPLMYVLGQVVSNKMAFAQRARVAFCLLFVTYSLITSLTIYLAPTLIESMGNSVELTQQATGYIQLECLAIAIGTIESFGALILLLRSQHRALLFLLALKSALLIIADTILVSQLPFSLTLGIKGVAVSNILVGLLLCGTVGWLLREDVALAIKRRHQKTQPSALPWMKTWLTVGARSGLESLVRNTAFVVMILQMVNQINQAGTYWLTNQFIWGWLLLPVLALGKVIQRDAACSGGMTKTRIYSYLKLNLLFVVVWLSSIPVWPALLHPIVGEAHASAVYALALFMLGFYIIFAFNHVIDSYFYGTGRTDLMLYQSLIVNIIFYGGAYVLYSLGMYQPTLNSIALLFGLGMTIDAAITWALYIQAQKTRANTLIYAVQ